MASKYVGRIRWTGASKDNNGKAFQYVCRRLMFEDKGKLYPKYVYNSGDKIARTLDKLRGKVS